jgi:hypothetical protein
MCVYYYIYRYDFNSENRVPQDPLIVIPVETANIPCVLAFTKG